MNTSIPIRLRSVAGVTTVQLIALLFPLLTVVLTEPIGYLLLLTTAATAALFWELLFAHLRGQSYGLHGLTTAILVVVFVPSDLPVWQLAIAVSLGVVLGELVFGGRGFGFANPAVISLSILLISFPEVHLPPHTWQLALAVIPGALILLALGLIAFEIVAAVFVGLGVSVLLWGGNEAGTLALATAVAFGLVFLICDPVSATVTGVGKWIYGALAGGLIALFSPAEGISPDAVVFAALLAAIFAPLIDHVVVLIHNHRRRRRCA